MTEMRGMVNIVGIKDLARRLFPPNEPLRATILAEDDLLEANEYLMKMKTWQRLLAQWVASGGS